MCSSWLGESLPIMTMKLLEKRPLQIHSCDRIFKDIFSAQFSSLPLNALDWMGLFSTRHVPGRHNPSAFMVGRRQTTQLHSPLSAAQEGLCKRHLLSYTAASLNEFFTIAHHNPCRPDLKVAWAPKSLAQVPIQPEFVHTGGLQWP